MVSLVLAIDPPDLSHLRRFVKQANRPRAWGNKHSREAEAAPWGQERGAFAFQSQVMHGHHSLSNIKRQAHVMVLWEGRKSAIEEWVRAREAGAAAIVN